MSGLGTPGITGPSDFERCQEFPPDWEFYTRPRCAECRDEIEENDVTETHHGLEYHDGCYTADDA